MKALRIVGIVVGGLLVVAAVVVGLVFLPAVQTWAVRKAVADRPGMTLEVGRVAVGLSSAEIGDVRVTKDGALVSIKRIHARYSAWNYITSNKIDVDQAELDGLAVDLRQMKVPAPASQPVAVPSPAAQVAPAFVGVLQLVQLPFDLRVARLSAKGGVTLPDGQTVALDVQGGDIENGKRGRIDWKIDFADGRKAVAVGAAHASGGIAVRITNDRRIDEIELQNTATVQGAGLPSDAIAVTVKATQAAPGADENYAAQVALVRQQKSEPLLKADVRFDAAARLFTGTWQAGVRSEQLAAMLAGFGLPETAVDGTGKFTYKPEGGAVTAEGEINARLSRLQTLSPALEAVGAMRLRTVFSAGFANEVASLKRLELEAANDDGKRLLQVVTRQNVAFNTRDKRVTLADPAAELAQVSVQGLPLAWAQPVLKPIAIKGGELSLRLSAGAEADGSRVRMRTIEPVMLRGVILREGDKVLVDGLSLSLSPQIDYNGAKAEVSASLEAIDLSLPPGDSVKGRVTAHVTALTAAAPVVSFAVTLQEKLVSVLKPYLPIDPGPLSADTQLEGRLEGQALQLGKFSMTVKRQGGALLASTETLQPLALNLASVRVTPADTGKPAVRVRLGEVPLAWAEAFVPKSKFDGGLSGGVLEVGLRSLEDLDVRTAEAIALRGIGAQIDGQSLARALDLSLELSAAKKGETATFDVRGLNVRQGEASLVRFAAAGSAAIGAKFSASAKGTIDADLPSLTKQPALAPYATLSRGNVAIAFDVTAAESLRAQAQVKVRQLVTSQGNKNLADVDISVDGSFNADGSGGSAKIPLIVTQGTRKSDVTVDASFGRTKAGMTFQAKVNGSQLVVDDLQAFAALAPQGAKAENVKGAASAQTPSGSAATIPARRTTTAAADRRTAASASGAGVASASGSTQSGIVPDRDAEAFWKGTAGGVEIALDKILYGETYRIQNLRCAAKIDDTQLALEKLEGRFNDNPFAVGASISFAGAQPQPYTLAGKVKIDQFDVGAFLRGSSPNDKPQLETKVSVTVDVGGKGGTALDLAKNVYGKFDVVGTPGVLRALGKRGETVGTVAKVIGIVGALRGSDTTMATAELASELNEMRFERFTMRAERGADLTVKLTSLEFISPTIKLTGNGSLANKPGVPIDQQPIQVVLQLAGKDHMAMLLNKAALLSGDKDAQGYYLMTRSFELGGTPSKPDSSQLWKIIGEAGLKAGAGMLFR